MRLFRNSPEGFLPVAGRLYLETVGLEPVVVDGVLRLRDPKSGELLPTKVDFELRAEAAEALVAKATAQAAEADARAERLAARLRELGVEE